jgi:hypothetical protein
MPTSITILQNGMDRGWVLKGVDEVSLLLEDMGLNLQVLLGWGPRDPVCWDGVSGSG